MTPDADAHTVAVVSDTHVPDREESIPEPFRERIHAADHVIHAGDFTDPEVLAEVRDLATELTAVYGNMDRVGDAPDAVALPETASATVGGVTFAVTHGTVRSLDEWHDAVAATAREVDGDPVVGVGGHTHRVEDVVHEGVRLLNPGSVTGAAPAERATMLTVAVADGDLDVTVHERER
jgi:putative phosphoesterase